MSLFSPLQFYMKNSAEAKQASKLKTQTLETVKCSYVCLFVSVSELWHTLKTETLRKCAPVLS